MRGILAACMVLILAGCLDSGVALRQRHMADLLKMEDAYSSGDLNKAEFALLEYRDKLLHSMSHAVEGLNYPGALGLVNGRLHAIYAHTGEKNKAEQYYNESVHWFNEHRVAGGLQPVDFTIEKLEELIRVHDRAWDLEWNVLPRTYKP